MIKLIVIMVEEEEEDDDNGDADGDYDGCVYGKRTMATTWDTWVILRSSLCQARCCFDIFNRKKIASFLQFFRELFLKEWLEKFIELLSREGFCNFQKLIKFWLIDSTMFTPR